jgi:hypothetical protein
MELGQVKRPPSPGLVLRELADLRNKLGAALYTE